MVDGAFNICSENCIEAELNFKVNTFVENGYPKQSLQSIITSCKQQKHNQQQQQQPEQIQAQDSNLKLVKLPWIPELSIKLKKIFKKAGYKAVFKSVSNLQTLLTSKNKCKLPINSYPGVYNIKCKCGEQYVGETKLKVSTRIQQHRKEANKSNTVYSGICEHSVKCNKDIEWDNSRTISIQPKYYERKIRETL